MTLETALQQIRPADQSAFQAVRAHWDSLAKPLGSLGELERAVAQSSVCQEEEKLQRFCIEDLIRCYLF